MFPKPWTRTLALAAAVIAFSGTPAKADNFLFSFAGSATDVITGEIFGLTNNSTSAATSIIFLTQPLLLNGHNLTPTTWQTVSANTFTETSGVITAADFHASDFFQFAGQPPGNGDQARFDLFTQFGTLIEIDTTFVAEFVVSGDVTFTNVPESSSAILPWTGLLAVALLAKNRTARRLLAT